jgi:murein DD-endopeptidase MepM/ murein hydrolase activator NlpD
MRSRYRRTNAFVSGAAIGWAATVGLLAGSMFFRAYAASLTRRSMVGHPMVKRTPATAVVPAIVVPPVAPVAGEPSGVDDDYEQLRVRKLMIPVEGYDQQRLRDSFQEARRGHIHEAIDLLAPRGTAVRAADDGPVRRLATAALGGITVYQTDAAGRYGYYYAHLDRYAAFLHEGQVLRKGDVLGYVGTTGNAPPGSPHLHFSIVRIDDVAHWWDGTPLNPYRVWAPLVPAPGGGTRAAS